MAEQLKNIYTKDFLLEFSRKVQSLYSSFDAVNFIVCVMDKTWDELALKARMRRISKQLGVFLPNKYETALDILIKISDECVGFAYLFFPDFVAVYGQAQEHWELSMSALENFTQKSSSEFAIRPFLLDNPKRVMKRMVAWAKHPNEHVRRLASEGCRPRLPWAEALPMFKQNPKQVLLVLELLKEDTSIYVRKSVANNLNDISKDNPDFVLEIIRQWKGKNPDTDWILRHGSRGLIKKANPYAMELFGYAKEEILTTHAFLAAQPTVLEIGEKCELEYEIQIREGEAVHIRIEYGIGFVKAKGHISQKTFLLSDKTVVGGTHLTAKRTHNWSNMTTRHHYPGEHKIVLLVNGQEVAHTVINLQEPKSKETQEEK